MVAAASDGSPIDTHDLPGYAAAMFGRYRTDKCMTRLADWYRLSAASEIADGCGRRGSGCPRANPSAQLILDLLMAVGDQLLLRLKVAEDKPDIKARHLMPPGAGGAGTPRPWPCKTRGDG